MFSTRFLALFISVALATTFGGTAIAQDKSSEQSQEVNEEAPQVATAESDHASWNFLGLDLKGSLREGLHSRYVPAMTNPIFNETPYNTTEVRVFYYYNPIPGDFVTEGGRILLAALQMRVALTERLGFIATKDGYADAKFDEVLDDEEGLANISLGFKYNFFSDPETETLATAGLRYEIPIQDLETNDIELQGNGDGFLNPFLTGAYSVGGVGVQGSIGAHHALDTNEDTSILHYSLHLDYEVLPGFFPMVELNGFTAYDRGNRSKGALGQLDGLDTLNFGSTDRDTTITGGVGFRYRFNDHLLFGAAYEAPMSGQDNTIMEYRVYGDLVLHF